MRSSGSDGGARWLPRLAILLVLAAVTVLGVLLARWQADSRREQVERDAAEQSAWANRGQMNRVIRDTAGHLGLDMGPAQYPDHALGCLRDDGRAGVSYFLEGLEAREPTDNSEALVDRAEEYWRALGYAVTRRPTADRVAHAYAVTPDGAVLNIVSGPTGTGIFGESRCALVDGGPGSDTESAG